jgi:hypothetical protein
LSFCLSFCLHPFCTSTSLISFPCNLISYDDVINYQQLIQLFESSLDCHRHCDI